MDIFMCFRTLVQYKRPRRERNHDLQVKSFAVETYFSILNSERKLFQLEITEKRVMDSKNGLELQDVRNKQIHMVCFKGSSFHVIEMRETKLAHGIRIKELLEYYRKQINAE